MPRGHPYEYQPLGDYLTAQPPEAGAVTLTLPEIEALIGAALPRTARSAKFWLNAPRRAGASAQARAWHEAGWRVLRLRRGPGPWAVTFERLPSR